MASLGHNELNQCGWPSSLMHLYISLSRNEWTDWGWVTHICVSKLIINGSDNGLSPGWHQAIIWTNIGILLTWPLGTNFSEISIETYIFGQENAFENVVCEMAAILSQPQCTHGRVFTYLKKLWNVVYYTFPNLRYSVLRKEVSGVASPFAIGALVDNNVSKYHNI